MKRIIGPLIIGVALIYGLIVWLKGDFQADDMLTKNVTAFYKAKDTVPSSKEELTQFEREMHLSPASLSFRKLQFSENGQGMIRIVSTRGFILRSEGKHEFLVGKKLNANKASQAIGAKAAPQPQR